MEVCGNACCVLAIVKDSGFLSLVVLKYVVCLGNGCDGCCAPVWEVRVFRHADVVCLCLVCILWKFSMLHSA